MKAKIGISDKNRQKVADEWMKIMSDEFILSTKTRNAHWNVEGSDFYSKHEFFQNQFEQLDKIIDQIAERIHMIGHYAPGTLKQFLQLTQLTETKSEKNDGQGFISELLSDHESIIITMRENINRFTNEYQDAGSGDLIVNLIEEHEKMSWFLRSHF